MKKSQFLISALLLIITSNCSSAQEASLKEHLLFYASFDGQSSAEIARGNNQIYTAENYKNASKAKAGLHDSKVVLAKGQGRFGDALHFTESKTSAVFYKAFKNVGHNKTSWSGTVSFWLRLDPNKGLPPHYCDPICITDTKWSDAGLWVDFTDHAVRKFRFGAMGDLAVWDPDGTSDESDWNKRTVTVDPSPFTATSWTHVALVYSNVNTSTPNYKLYLNGVFQGEISRINDPFTWEAQNGKIMLGLGYIGLLDELAIFNKALDDSEIKRVFKAKDGVKGLIK